MRLSWPFRRQQQAAPTPTRGDVFGARAKAAQAWRNVPVLPTTLGKPPLIAPTPPFRADLAGAAAPPIALAPLTHGRPTDAPRGVAGGRTTTIQRSPSEPSDRPRAEMTVRQRREVRDLAPEQTDSASDAAPPAADRKSLTKPPIVVAATPAAVRSFVSASGQSLQLAPAVGMVGAARTAA